MRAIALKFAAWIFTTVALLGLALPAAADAPRLLSFQGYLTTSGGVPINASLQMTFKLYDGPSVGAALAWTEAQTVAVNNGVYSVLLGSGTALPTTFNSAYWVGISVGVDAEMTPRQRLVAAPYALFAAAAGCNNGDKIECYTGPAGTEGVGPCAAGVRICTGGVFGNCSAVVPIAEICGDGIDNNCNGVADDACPLPNGSACSTDGQCASTFCTDGFCCNARCGGNCAACQGAKTGGSNGTCGFITNNTDPDAECAGSNVCNGAGVCVTPPLANGSACTTNSQCISTLCRDNVCCNTVCSGNCVACTTAKKGSGADGVCGFIAPATDPDAECAGALTCNGAGVCS